MGKTERLIPPGVRIPIGGVKFRYREVSQKRIDALGEEFIGASGAWLPDSGEVWVRSDASLDVRGKRLCHEIGHALEEAFGFELDDNPNGENEVVKVFDNAVYYLLTEPNLAPVRAIFERLGREHRGKP